MQNTILLCIFLYPYTLFPNVVVLPLFLFWFQRFVESSRLLVYKYIIIIIVVIILILVILIAVIFVLLL